MSGSRSSPGGQSQRRSSRRIPGPCRTCRRPSRVVDKRSIVAVCGSIPGGIPRILVKQPRPNERVQVDLCVRRSHEYEAHDAETRHCDSLHHAVPYGFAQPCSRGGRRRSGGSRVQVSAASAALSLSIRHDPIPRWPWLARSRARLHGRGSAQNPPTRLPADGSLRRRPSPGPSSAP